MCARATPWRDAVMARVFIGAMRSSTCLLIGSVEDSISKQSNQRLTIRRVALGESLVFNVASQKNAISDGFCPFLSGVKSLGTKRRQQVCMTHLFFGTVRKVCLVRSI